MFSDFRIAYYRFTLQVGEEGLVLPPFKGDLLRQTKFEAIMRRQCCITKRAVCDGECIAKTDCPYALLFTTVDATPLSPRKLHSLAPPVTWHPPLEKKTEYVAGENIYYHLALVGRSVSFLDKYIFAMRELGAEGMAGGRFSLQSVVSICPLSGKKQLVYEHGNEHINDTNLFVSGRKMEAWAEAQLPLKRFQILFLTPTCLQIQGENMQEPLFPVLMRELFRKVTTLYYYFHNNKEMEANYRELQKKAEKIEIMRDQTRFYHENKRGGTYGDAVGLLGEVVYSNPDPEFLPLFKLGEFINLGPQATFGFGRYRLKT